MVKIFRTASNIFLFFTSRVTVSYSNVFIYKKSINCNAKVIRQKLKIWTIVLELIDDKVDVTKSFIFKIFNILDKILEK